MAGNVWEWTRTAYRPYPYREDDGRSDAARPGRYLGPDDAADGDRKVVRGGSWYDRPKGARSASRLGYPPWRCVYDVGLRVVCGGARASASSGEPSAQRRGPDDASEQIRP